jgi:hypothetical protein
VYVRFLSSSKHAECVSAHETLELNESVYNRSAATIKAKLDEAHAFDRVAEATIDCAEDDIVVGGDGGNEGHDIGIEK